MNSILRTQQKQTDILKVSVQLFLERGYDAVSLDDIVEKVGGSKSTLYSYYGGKEGLFAAAVQGICKVKLAPLLALDVSNVDPRTGLNAIGKQFLLIISDPQGRAIFRMMISEAERFPELAGSFFNSGPRQTIRALRRSIERWQENGLLRSGNPEVMATHFLGIMMSDFHSKMLLGLMKPPTEKQIETFVFRGTELFLEGALPRLGLSI